MPVLYKITPVKGGLNPEKKTRYIAFPCKRQKADVRMIARMIAERSSLSSGNALSALNSLAEIVPNLLAENYTVHLPPLGIFSLSFSSESYENEEDVNFRSVKKVKMKFRADKEIIKKLKNVEVRKG